MAELTVQLEGQIGSVELLSDYGGGLQGSEIGNAADGGEARSQAQQQELIADLEGQKSLFEELNRTMASAAESIKKFKEELFASHGEQIAKLSVEIARKVLIQKVSQRDYEIETIIKEVVSNTPSREEVVLYLNPEDLATFEKSGNKGEFAGIKFAADAEVGAGECRLESPKGIVESVISENLKQIEKVLKMAE